MSNSTKKLGWEAPWKPSDGLDYSAGNQSFDGLDVLSVAEDDEEEIGGEFSELAAFL